jgi:hypothetical protein
MYKNFTKYMSIHLNQSARNYAVLGNKIMCNAIDYSINLCASIIHYKSWAPVIPEIELANFTGRSSQLSNITVKPVTAQIRYVCLLIKY